MQKFMAAQNPGHLFYPLEPKHGKAGATCLCTTPYLNTPPKLGGFSTDAFRCPPTVLLWTFLIEPFAQSKSCAYCTCNSCPTGFVQRSLTLSALETGRRSISFWCTLCCTHRYLVWMWRVLPLSPLLLHIDLAAEESDRTTHFTLIFHSS